MDNEVGYKQEGLLSEFSEIFFFKEFVQDSLQFTPKGYKDEVELADLILNFDEYIIAIQLKTRNPRNMTNDIKKEKNWLEKNVKRGKKQLVETTIPLIKEGNTQMFSNKQGQKLEIKSDAKIIPLVIFKNDMIKRYDKVLRRHSEDGININCMKYEDFIEMCKKLVSPIEIKEYLEYRLRFFESNSNNGYFFYEDKNGDITIARKEYEDAMIAQYILERYGEEFLNIESETLYWLGDRLSVFKEHIEQYDEENSYYEIMLLLTSLNRVELNLFAKYYMETLERARKGEYRTCAVFGNEDKYSVVFLTVEKAKMINLQSVYESIQYKRHCKHILIIEIYCVDNINHAADFHLYYR